MRKLWKSGKVVEKWEWTKAAFSVCKSRRHEKKVCGGKSCGKSGGGIQNQSGGKCRKVCGGVRKFAAVCGVWNPGGSILGA